MYPVQQQLEVAINCSDWTFYFEFFFPVFLFGSYEWVYEYEE